MARTGLFIAFEGPDGSGKSTQAKIFSQRLFDASKYNHVLLTREPYNSEEIRRRLREEPDANANAEIMADLFIADRKSHLENLIVPALNQGIHVVTDRFELSTEAYQATQGMNMDSLIKRHEDLVRYPHVTYWLSVTLETARKRNDKQEQKFEQEEFQRKLIENYDRACGKLIAKGRHIITINGEQAAGKVADDIWNDFHEYFV